MYFFLKYFCFLYMFWWSLNYTLLKPQRIIHIIYIYTYLSCYFHTFLNNISHFSSFVSHFSCVALLCFIFLSQLLWACLNSEPSCISFALMLLSVACPQLPTIATRPRYFSSMTFLGFEWQLKCNLHYLLEWWERSLYVWLAHPYFPLIQLFRLVHSFGSSGLAMEARLTWWWLLVSSPFFFFFFSWILLGLYFVFVFFYWACI